MAPYSVYWRIRLRSGLDSRRIPSWKRPGKAERLAKVQEVHKFRGGSIMAWGGIMMNWKIKLILVRGKITVNRYESYILQPIFLPFAREYGTEFLYMHNIAKSYTATTILEWFEDHNIPLLGWPAQSPDLNQILWGNLQNRILEDIENIETQDQLFAHLPHHWQRINQNEIRNLISSLPKRCRAIFNAKNGNTNYWRRTLHEKLREKGIHWFVDHVPTTCNILSQLNVKSSRFFD